ncbi:MAG: NTP transferase domain-containing protein [Vicinamibacterales bacterium]
MIHEAVILAAGSGLRLDQRLPKGLTPISGRPLLAWIAAALAECGVTVAHAIVSDRTEFETRLADLSHDIELRLSECPDSHLGNGRSAAYAEHLLTYDRFFLLMSDHLIGAPHLRCVAAAAASACSLGTSARAPWIDLDDATKVVVDDAGFIREIGKELRTFDAIDTGVFAMTRAVFPALEEARRSAEYSLTAGNRRLCRDGLLRAAPIGDLRWYDIDTATDLATAEAWWGQTGG